MLTSTAFPPHGVPRTRNDVPIEERAPDRLFQNGDPLRIYLFRHGPAGRRDASRWPEDGERPLTTRGAERTEQSAVGLARLAAIAHVISSPLLRATQTGQIVREALGLDEEMEILDALSPGGSYRAVLQHLAEVDGNDGVVLVGHEPDLGKLAATMLFGAPAEALPLKKAGVHAIAFDGPPQAGTGRLMWSAPPRLLRRLARRKSKV